ncbi:MAG TPA: EAL domain-containing protein, partial [Gammaproteobacteria bacterium]|nr:EAL domain-containing protein [Gammaproteobacteria bacterium]
APLEKVIGSEIHIWFAPEGRQVLQTLLRKDTADNRGEELALAAADGTRVPAYLSVSRLLLDQTPDSICMVVTDLTAQKRSEAILATENLARAILEQAADAIVICDEAGRIIRASKQAQAFCGKNPVGQSFEHAFPLRQLNGAAFSPVGAVDATRRQSVEARLEHNGQGFDLLVSVGHLLGVRDKLLGSVVTLTDITEQRRAAEALRASEAEFRTLAESMPQIVWITRPDGGNIYFNQQWMDYTGLTLEESSGHGWRKPFHPDDQQRAWDAWQLATATNGIYSIEGRLRRTDGIYRWWLVRGVPLQDAAGNILKWFGTCTDIHDLKVAELEILATNRGLRESEIRIKRLNRVYAVLSGINSLIVRVHDRDELFREACRIAVGEGGLRMAWIATVGRGAPKLVPVASAGVSEDLLLAIKEHYSSSKGALQGNTPAAQVIREKKPFVSNDSRDNPSHVFRFRAEYNEAGIRSIAVLPLMVADEVAGVFALYAGETGFFDEEEMKLLTELAGDIAFAIDHIDKQERLDYLAYYDALTGLANRSLFIERLAQYLRSAAGGGHKLALFLIDLERFKNINDSLGRPAGDALLLQVAQWLTRNAGDANLLARVGPDHFAVVLPEVRQDGELAHLLEQRMEAFLDHPFRLNDAVFRIAIKVGVALYPDDGADAEALFRNAEAALKKAKAGGDRYLFHTQQMTEAVAGTLTLENKLRQALDKDEFVLHYQPKVNLVSGKLTSVEALIRWNDPRTGLVPPGRFIPILEETGLITEVGRWALRKALEDYLRWRNSGLAAVRIAVNVSPMQLRNRGFIDEIRQAIGIDAQAAAGLELEITESLIMEDVRHSIASLQAIRALGVTIAIDDFGTGFSSLSYLAKLPVDTLKIDRSFVTDMTAGPEGLALVSTIINLAHSLKLKVVAEGVETEEQSRLLRLLNCDEMQGYLFSKPVPAAEMAALLANAGAAHILG